LLRAGAAAYLVKPLGVELFRKTLDGVARRRRLAEGAFCGMVGASPAMERMFDLVRRVSDSHATVLVEGESGSGKELVARAIHASSHRAGGPFVPVNCAALSAGLLESELFGHEKGAFTGAYTSRKGRFEAASGGTLFLDEIGEMDVVLQAKLLRALEEMEIVRVGSNDPIVVDVRVVAATNRPLKKRLEEGTFRQDLYYRLNVVRVTVPALRERPGDIPLLAAALLDELAREHGRDVPEVDDELLPRLAALPWPGNVRQLRNCVETMLLTAGGDVLTLDDVPAELQGVAGPSGTPLSMRPIAEMERELIENTLEELRGNRAQAARALGISTRTLYRRIKELGLS